MKELEGLSISIIVSDPWDFCTAHGTGPFRAKILRTGRDDETGHLKALIELDHPLVFQAVEYRYLVSEDASYERPLESLLARSEADCGMAVISQERVDSSNPLDLSWWRGGPALTGTIKIAE